MPDLLGATGTKAGERTFAASWTNVDDAQEAGLAGLQPNIVGKNMYSPLMDTAN
jgi:hypothetical protein